MQCCPRDTFNTARGKQIFNALRKAVHEVHVAKAASGAAGSSSLSGISTVRRAARADAANAQPSWKRQRYWVSIERNWCDGSKGICVRVAVKAARNYLGSNQEHRLKMLSASKKVKAAGAGASTGAGAAEARAKYEEDMRAEKRFCSQEGEGENLAPCRRSKLVAQKSVSRVQLVNETKSR